MNLIEDEKLWIVDERILLGLSIYIEQPIVDGVGVSQNDVSPTFRYF
jgi:hypothetical protein